MFYAYDVSERTALGIGKKWVRLVDSRYHSRSAGQPSGSHRTFTDKHGRH